MDASIVLDWEKTIVINDGVEADATHILHVFYSQSLPETKRLFVTGFNDVDITALRAACHRLSGSLLYFSLPNLQLALSLFHKTIKEEPENKEKMKKGFDDLIQAIDTFCDYYKNHFVVENRIEKDK